jgi:hypothetical protein
MWPELLVRHETAIAAIGEIRDGLLIDGVWVGEIGGVVKIYFALMDDGTEEIEDFAEDLVDLLAYLRECVDGDGLRKAPRPIRADLSSWDILAICRCFCRSAAVQFFSTLP